jgi:hypothetical protein
MTDIWKPSLNGKSDVGGARARLLAWCRVLEGVADQREALEHRIWCEDPEDVFLEADIQTWRELTRALVAFLEARRTA